MSSKDKSFKKVSSSPFTGSLLTLTALLATTSLSVFYGTGFGSRALAQEKVQDKEDVIVSIGTRRSERSVSDTPAPIDVIGGEEFVRQGSGDLNNQLRTIIPSYNINAQPISDAATFVRPANLRGLSPDQTLVLWNGKRRHRASVISFLGNGVSDGAQGPDISVIPALALKQVDILRDAASAQYGSDAIAGVMNFILKDSTDGLTLEAKYGSTYKSDGGLYQFSANYGMPLTENGFANFTVELLNVDPTSRSVQRDDASALFIAGNEDIANPAQIWGTPKIRGDFKAFANLGIELDNDKEVYAFGNYAQREVVGGFFIVTQIHVQAFLQILMVQRDL